MDDYDIEIFLICIVFVSFDCDFEIVCWFFRDYCKMLIESGYEDFYVYWSVVVDLEVW